MAETPRILTSESSAPLSKLSRSFIDFFNLQATSGIILLLCAVAALIWIHSPWGDSYHHFWETPLGLGVGSRRFELPLHAWINDGLMAIFFFVVGLEIKREILVGDLSTPRKAALPAAAALGGMVVPAGIYAVFNYGGEALSGWGIPMATDIAFSLGLLALLGNRVPPQIRIFLAALAIVDDLGAILVIAMFYTSQLSATNLAAAGALCVIIYGLGRLGLRHPLAYILLGGLLWVLVYRSGIHATIAGVLLAFTIPAHSAVGAADFMHRSKRLLDEFGTEEQSEIDMLASERRLHQARRLEHVCEAVRPPLHYLMKTFEPWATYAIMPLFALANSGVLFEMEPLGSGGVHLASGIALGLIVGKPLGIFLGAWIAVKMGLAYKSSEITWLHILGVGALAGVGFTMSLFIANLAFSADNLELAKRVILLASTLAALIGLVLLYCGSKAQDNNPNPEPDNA